MTAILLLKSAFSIIDQIFQQEILLAEDKKRTRCSSCCYKPPKSLQDTNEFISFIMDPFQLWRAEKEIVSDDDDDDEDDTCDKKKNIWLKKKSVHELV